MRLKRQDAGGELLSFIFSSRRVKKPKRAALSQISRAAVISAASTV
jgi:hypothetical protein